MRTSPVYKAEAQLLMIKVAQLQLILYNHFSCKTYGANRKKKLDLRPWWEHLIE